MKRTIIIFALLHTTTLYAQTDVAGGQTIFKRRCASCHNIKEKVVGPALKDIHQRHTDEWTIKFVHSSQELIKNGDAAAVKLFEENNQTLMPDHTDLKENDIKNIIAYIKEESAKLDVAGSTQPFLKPYDPIGNERPLTKNDYLVFIVWGLFISLLLIATYIIIQGIDALHHFHKSE